MRSGARNALIVAGIAALVVLIPGGGTGAAVAGQAVSLAFLAALVWFAVRQYRENRIALESLGDRHRLILYTASGVLTLTLTASHRLWATGGGLIAWFALVSGAVYAIFAVLTAARRS